MWKGPIIIEVLLPGFFFFFVWAPLDAASAAAISDFGEDLWEYIIETLKQLHIVIPKYNYRKNNNEYCFDVDWVMKEIDMMIWILYIIAMRNW